MIKEFFKGAKCALPLFPGILPFGLIMGTTAQGLGHTLFESIFLNLSVFAGASQLVGLDLLNKGIAVPVIVLTGMLINLRFSIYALSLAPFIAKGNIFKKVFLAYLITDQAYGVTIQALEKKDFRDSSIFFLGAALTIACVWQTSNILGFILGNILPESLNLSFSIPLIFMALLIPLLRDKRMIIVASFSALISLGFHWLPFKLGMICTIVCSLIFTWLFFIRGKSFE